MIADTIEKTRHNIKVLSEASKKFGLEINEEKCKILIFKASNKRKRDNVTEKEIEEVEGIKVVKSLKYLGVTIENKQNLFKKHKDSTIQKANLYANMTYGVIKKSANKMLVGKTYWKNTVLPSILQNLGVIPYTNTEIKELQEAENSVYRKILGAIRSTPICTLRGEVGSSMMKARFIQAKLGYLRSMVTGENGLVQEILEKIRNEKPKKRKANKNKKNDTELKKPKTCTWKSQLIEFLDEINIKYGEIKTMSKEEIKKRVREWDTVKWEEDLNNKKSVKIYKNFKEKIKDDGCYDNKFASKLLFKARSNTLNLNIQKRHQKGDTSCILCEEEKEDLVHFIVNCSKLEDIRDEEIFKESYDENREQMVGKILHNNEKIETVKNMLEEMWKYRSKMKKEKEKK